MRRPAFRTLVSAGCILFLAWFAMKFYMDTSNDSETEAYIRALTASATHGTIATDLRGHYTALAPYVLWPFTATLQRVTAGYEIRGYVFARLFVGTVLNAAAYLWYRRLGLGWLTSLLGLILLSTSSAFALLISGWELDKVIEPALFLLAAIAAWNGRYIALLGIAALAAANRETGMFVPLVALAGLAREAASGGTAPSITQGGRGTDGRGIGGRGIGGRGLGGRGMGGRGTDGRGIGGRGIGGRALGGRGMGGLPAAITRWPVWVGVVLCAAEVAWFRSLVPTPTLVVLDDLKLDRLVFVIGGMCLLPLLAVAWVRAVPVDLQRLFYLVAPAWVALVLGLDRLDQGALLLTPLALLFIPVTLSAVEQPLRARR